MTSSALSWPASGAAAWRRRPLVERYAPIATIVLALIAIWYVAAVLMNLALVRGGFEREEAPYTVSELIEGTITAASHELSGHPVDMQPVHPGSAVWADRQMLQMAILQLFDNAAKYGSPDSAITIGVQEEEAEALISVRNEGSLIAPEEKEKIFQRFYRSPGSDHRASGTGIGLSVVKRITEAHHGRVWVTSDQQNGTTFFLALPRMAKEK